MRRILLNIGIGILVLIPLVLFVIQRIQHPIWYFTSWLPPQKSTSVAPQYSVESQVPGYTIKLLDAQFLDYVANNIGIFQPNAVVDPEVYQGGMPVHHTVSHIMFTIVPAITKFLFAVPGQKDMAAFGDYSVSRDTLVLRVQYNAKEVAALQPFRYALEDKFLRASLTVMYYAHGGMSDPKAAGHCESWIAWGRVRWRK